MLAQCCADESGKVLNAVINQTRYVGIGILIQTSIRTKVNP